ncbi:MAG: flagellar basal-body MS-ring/collar protein FliF [Ignavibacterium sp.]|nr:flagellar basal-body MS-ring/collar protein FliF [Ignavibacterium sp.]MCX7612542.1 flagellar basal-body MS-ring/collar protein FliF [Ignavibacterium sp.]MDW8374120.1 flagellar basal-body MS-ring/collar protein FliF [Ignavibacteriales bacterium]
MAKAKASADSIRNFINSLTIKQKIVIGVSVVTTFVLIILLISIFNQPSYGVLFADLSQQDASKVIEYLSSQKIPYQIEDNGSVIKVPRDKIYETRIELAGKGLPSSGTIGYELFDKTTMGMSDFMQKLNYKRALEGELARTIMGQEGIEGARVHLVFPEKSIFKDEQIPPTASVVIKLRDNYKLPKEKAAAIVNFISSSVEGLTTNNITLIDTKGRLLWKEDAENNSMSFASTKQYEIKNSIETYLAQKAQNLLDNVLGFGNALVQVNVDLNFNQVEKTMEIYDPESQVVISEQVSTGSNSGISVGDTTQQSNENTITNYEVSKTIQKVIEETGNIKRLSVAAVINDIPKTVEKDGKQVVEYTPRPPEQIRKIEELLKGALGISQERNDVISIVNIPFETKPLDDELNNQPSSWLDDKNEIINLILVILAIAGSILLLKNLTGKIKSEKVHIGTVDSERLSGRTSESQLGKLDTKEKPQTELSAAGKSTLLEIKKKREQLPIGDLEEEISIEAINRENQIEKIKNYIMKNPADASKLINTWLYENE